MRVPVCLCVCVHVHAHMSLTLHLVCTIHCGSYTSEVLSRPPCIQLFTNIFGSVEVCNFPLFHYTIYDLNPSVELLGPISLLRHEFVPYFLSLQNRSSGAMGFL